MAIKRKSGLITLALAFCPPEFRAQFGEQIQADASQGDAAATALDIAVSGIGLRIESFARDLAFAVRILRKTPLLTSAAIITLAVATSVNAVVFGAINSILLKPLPFNHPEQLAFVCGSGGGQGACDYPLQAGSVGELFSMNRSIEEVAAFRLAPTVITGLGVAQDRLSASLSSNFFHVMQLRPEVGRFFTAADGRPGARNVVISDKTWRSLYGADPRILGRAIGLSGVPWRVVGVVPADFVMPTMNEVGLQPQTVDVFEALPHDVRLWNSLGTYFSSFTPELIMRSQAGLSSTAMEAELDRAAAQEIRRARSVNIHLHFLPVSLAGWYHNINNIQLILSIALAASVVVLIIACANVANLLLARGSARQAEFAVRGVLGATRARVIRQLLVEVGLLAIVSGIIGAALAYGELQLVSVLNPAFLPRIQDVSINGRILLFTCAAVAAVTFLAGLIPAFMTTPSKLASALGEAGRGRDGVGGRAFRGGLVVLELALSFVVIASSVLLMRSTYAIVRGTTDIDPRNVYTANVNLLPERYATAGAQAAFADSVLARLREIPAIESATISRGMPYADNGPDWTTAVEPSRQSGTALSVTAVSPAYFDVLRIPIVRGRAFNDRDRALSLPVVILGAGPIKIFKLGPNPVGKKMWATSMSSWTSNSSAAPQLIKATIVGVSGAITANNGVDKREDDAYVPFTQHPSRLLELSMRVRAADPRLRDAVQTAVASVDPDVAVTQFTSLSEHFAKVAAPQRTSASLLGAIALVALLLGLIGTYAVVAYSVERRRHEFGIRKAIGAQTTTVLTLVLKDAVVYALAGIAAGVTLSAASTKALTNILVRTSPLDPLTFGCAIVLLVAGTLAAALIPAIRAMRVDAAVALRYE